VTIEAEPPAPGEPRMMLVKLQSSAWELNFPATREELLSMRLSIGRYPATPPR
jgi:hypothetical protein